MTADQIKSFANVLEVLTFAFLVGVSVGALLRFLFGHSREN